MPAWAPDVRGERPQVVVDGSNRALAVFRRFGQANVQGVVSVAAADLSASSLAWSDAGALSAAAGLNWQTAFAVDATTGAIYSLSVHSAPATAGGQLPLRSAAGVSSLSLGAAADLAVSRLAASNLHPSAGEPVTLTAAVRNDGLAAAPAGVVVRFYRGDAQTGLCSARRRLPAAWAIR